MPIPEKFREALIKYNIGSDVIDRVNADYEDLVSDSSRAQKREYFKRAMDMLDLEVSHDIANLIDDNGCGTANRAREKSSKNLQKI